MAREGAIKEHPAEPRLLTVFDTAPGSGLLQPADATLGQFQERRAASARFRDCCASGRHSAAYRQSSSGCPMTTLARTPSPRSGANGIVALPEMSAERQLAGSAAIVLTSVPSFSTLASMRSPGLSQTGFSDPAMTPAGAPEVMTSPGSKVMLDHHETKSRTP
jgi:hypothetical protein